MARFGRRFPIRGITIKNIPIAASTGYFGILKRYDGAAFVKAKLKYYAGSFLVKPLKRWTGTEWKEVDIYG